MQKPTPTCGALLNIDLELWLFRQTSRHLPDVVDPSSYASLFRPALRCCGPFQKVGSCFIFIRLLRVRNLSRFLFRATRLLRYGSVLCLRYAQEATNILTMLITFHLQSDIVCQRIQLCTSSLHFGYVADLLEFLLCSFFLLLFVLLKSTLYSVSVGLPCTVLISKSGTLYCLQTFVTL